MIWENHGHLRNANYNNVVLHLLCRRGPRRFFTRTSENHVDQHSALPRPRRPRHRPTSSAPGTTLDETLARALIEAAAQYRFHRKADRFQRRPAFVRIRTMRCFRQWRPVLVTKTTRSPSSWSHSGRDSNAPSTRGNGEAPAFRAGRASRAPKTSRAGRRGRPRLPARTLGKARAIRDGESRLALADEAWKYATVRPANHPHRRMGALAAVARSVPPCIAEAHGHRNLREIPSHRSSTPIGTSTIASPVDPLPRPAAPHRSGSCAEITVNALLPSLPARSGLGPPEASPGLQSECPRAKGSGLDLRVRNQQACSTPPANRGSCNCTRTPRRRNLGGQRGLARVGD